MKNEVEALALPPYPQIEGQLVSFWCQPELVERLDRMRGRSSRSQFIRNVLSLVVLEDAHARSQEPV